MRRSRGWEPPALPTAFSRGQEKVGGSKRADSLFFQQDKTSSEGEFSWEWAGGRSGVGRLRSEGGWARGAGGFVPRSPFLGPKTSPDEHFGEEAAVGKAHPCGLPFAQPFTPLQSGPEWSQARPWELRCPLGALERCWSSAGMRDLAGEHHPPPGALLRGLGVTLGQHPCGAPEAALPVDTIFFPSWS